MIRVRQRYHESGLVFVPHCAGAYDLRGAYRLHTQAKEGETKSHRLGPVSGLNWILRCDLRTIPAPRSHFAQLQWMIDLSCFPRRRCVTECEESCCKDEDHEECRREYLVFHIAREGCIVITVWQRRAGHFTYAID